MRIKADLFEAILWLLGSILTFIFIKTLIFLTLFPIYPDEIGGRLWLSRTLLDFPYHVNIIPASENHITPLSLFWYFPGLVESFIHGFINSLYTLRLVGIAFYVLVIVMLSATLISSQKKASPPWPLRFSIVISVVFIISLLSLGVLPVFFITNRAEQIILIFLISVLFFCKRLLSTPATITSVKSILYVLGFFICIIMMFYMHPKSLYFAPVFFLAAYTIFRHLKKKYLIFSFIFLSILLAGNLQAWKAQLSFHNDPVVEQFMNSFNINPADILTSPRLFVHQFLHSLKTEKSLLTKIEFQKRADVNYLPPLQLDKKEKVINRVIIFYYLSLFVILLMAIIRSYFADFRKNNFFSFNLILLSTFGSILIWNLLNLTKTWYDVGYFWATLSIICVFFITENLNKIKRRTACQVVIISSIICIISLQIFHLNYRYKILHGYAGPSVPLVNFHFKEYQKTLRLAEVACFADKKASNNLALDDYTYLYFKRSKYPVLVTYINHHTTGNKFPALIKQGKISSIIIRCSSFVSIPNLKEKSLIHIGNICCYPGNKLKELT